MVPNCMQDHAWTLLHYHWGIMPMQALHGDLQKVRICTWMMYCRGPREKEVPLITKLTEGRVSTAAQPPANRHVFVSAEYTIPGMACKQSASSAYQSLKSSYWHNQL